MSIDISTKTIKEVAEQCLFTAREHGFVDTNPNIDQKLLLAVGELAEAQEELRAGHAATEIYYHDMPAIGGQGLEYLPKGKPEGFPIELADAVIRIFDLAESLGIDIQAAIELKMNYNEGRPYKHGKQF